MIVYNTIAFVSFIIPMAFTYHYNIEVSIKLNVTNCQRRNNSSHLCGSLISMFQLLSQLSDSQYSTDVFIHSGTYILNESPILQDVQNIQIRSNASKPAIITCQNNSDLNTGVVFLRVRDLVIDHLTIVGCGMKHNSTSYLPGKKFVPMPSAIFIQNSTNISMANVNISNSTGIGLVIYDTDGLVNFTGSFFANNKLKSNLGGGGIHIEFTECTTGRVLCNSRNNPYNKHSKYIIDRCTFKDNAATYESLEVEDLTLNHFVTFGTGGGLSLWFNGQAKHNQFKIVSSNFISNSAITGGGLHVNSRQNAMDNCVIILWCSFIGNFGYKEGGGLAIGNVIHQTGGVSKFNEYNIINCFFANNQALTGVGGGILGFGSRESEPIATYHFKIQNSSFISNKAKFGSAIQINREYFDSVTVGSIFTLVLENCNFTGNNLDDNSGIAAVAMSEVNIRFQGYTCFNNNTSTALVVDGATMEFGNDSVVVFQDNRGLYGGAISLIEGAKIIIYPNSTLLFLRNTAVERGGAIHVELSTPFDHMLSHVCFIRYHSENVLPSEWETNFTFISNTARQNNNSIFISTLQPCIKAYSTISITKLFDKPFYHYPDNSEGQISTLPATFKFNNNSNEICTFVSDESFNLTCSIAPGEVFDLPVILQDELEMIIDSAMFLASCTGSKSPYVPLPYHFTNGTIQIAGKPNEICNLTLQTNTDYPASTIIQITLLHCPPGLFYDVNKRQCQCVVSHSHQIPAIIGCEMTYLQAYFNKFYWIGYELDDNMNLMYGLCPYYYCSNKYLSTGQLLPRDTNKTLLDKFVCGGRRRTGLLCGQCIKGYSVVMNSPTYTCHKCKDVYLGTLYLVLSYILPVSVLFYIIMSYNIRMTSGVISAYLFISQIAGSHNYYSSLKAENNLPFTISNIVVSIYSLSNLEFFQHDIFSYCLFSNAGSVDILAFKLLLSFYPILLILIYFLLRCSCVCKHHRFQRWRLSNKAITHGISAFLVLCFAKINVLSFAILNSTELFYINGTSYKRIVHFQGNIEYFGEPLYNLYASISLLALVIIVIIPTMILLLHPILINVAIYFELGESKFILLINKVLLIYKLKPVLDTFQGDYKDKMHYFAGLHFFLYKIVFFCIVVMASTANVSRLYLLVATYFLVILLIHVLAMPFKTFINNAVYSLAYCLLIMITTMEYHLFSDDKLSHVIIYSEILLSLLPIACIVVYCLWKLSISVIRFCEKQKGRSDQLSSVSNLMICNKLCVTIAVTSQILIATYA